MATQMTATVQSGMLKPDEILPFADQSRVRLTIEPIEESTRQGALAAWEAIKGRLRERPLHFGGQRYTRDELYERS